MSISLNNFVTINLTRSYSSTISDLRDEVVVYTDSTTTDGYKTVFAANGGNTNKITVVSTDSIDFDSLPRNAIMVTYVGENGSSVFGELVKANATSENKKIVVVAEEIDNIDSISDALKSDYTVVKLVKKGGVASGDHMSVLGYFSTIRLYGTDTAKDYAFTIESGVSAVTDSDTIVKSVISKNMNVSVQLAGQVRNIGGNMFSTNDIDMINQFMYICLQQTLGDRLISLLSNKLKYNTSGIATVSNVLVNELNRYVTNGYISLNKFWEGSDLYIDDELVVANGSALTDGYKIHISPLSTLTDTEKKAHQFPAIYIVYAEGYNIRKIAITGNIF